MELEKFYQAVTGEVVYVVTGAKNRIEAFKFVSQYKKMKYSKMLLTHKILKGRVSGEDLYTGNLKNIEGKDCLIVARNSIELNSNKF